VWFCGGIAALALSSWAAAVPEASAQSTRLQVQKSTNKSTQKKDFNNPAAKPPTINPTTPKPPAITGGTVQNLKGLSRLSYAPPNTWAIYPISGYGAMNSFNTAPPAFIPGLYVNPYQNPYANVYNPLLSVNPNPYASPYAPLNPLAYNQYPQLPYYNSLYTTYAPNPLINVNPAFLPYNPYNPLGQTQANPFMSYPQPFFPGIDGFGGSLGGGLLYRGLGY
jgi:hypothetical protein